MSDDRLQMCKGSSTGCPAPFQAAPTPTRTQKWTPVIFSSLFPAGPDTPRAEPGAAPADTAPAPAAAASPEQTPPAPLQPHPRGSWRGDAARPAPPQPTDTGAAGCSGLAPAPKPARRGLEQEGKPLGGLCLQPPPPFWYGEAEARHGTHPGTPTALWGCRDFQPGRRGGRLMVPHPGRHNGGTGYPVPSLPERSRSSPSTRCSYDSPRLPSPGNSQQHFSIILSSAL